MAERGPDLSPLRGVVAPEILSAARTASRKLREAGIPHALAGGLAVGAHGYPSTTADVPLPVLVYMKLKAGRQKDLADLVELLKRGRIEIDVVDRYLTESAPHQLRRWERVKEIAASEE